MLGSTAPLHTASATTTTTTSSSRPPDSERERRSSRLRGLSYRFSNHLHSSRSSDAAPPLSRSTSSPGTANNSLTATPTLSRTRSSARRPNTQTPTNDRDQTPTSPARIESRENGWIPTVQGRNGLSRESAQPTSTSTASATPEPNSTTAMMTRNRSTTAVAIGPTPTTTASPPQRRPSALEPSPGAPPAMSESSSAMATGSTTKDLPTIRFIPHVETRSSRPSLHFSAVSRTLKTTNSVVRVGRYSERDSATNEPNTLPVGFKSKVVSRRHCEFWCTDGQWYIRDVKSSSGTFLNHVRLSSPGQESRPYPVNDGDVVQLGIDFKGGEEVIFRCVKIRVECNRGWQKSLNSFNTSAHKRLLKNAVHGKTRDSDAASVNSSECSICLNAVAPCQALFVAPCSHVWHYKCIRNLIHSPQWPNFVCPNCRFVADLEADVEQPEDNDLDIDTGLEPAQFQGETRGAPEVNVEPIRDESSSVELAAPVPSLPRNGSVSRLQQVDEDLAALLSNTALTVPSPQPDTSRDSEPESPLGTRPIRIALPSPGALNASDPLGARSMTPTSHTQFALAPGPMIEGPLTPRNDAGPFILDEREEDRAALQSDNDLDESTTSGDIPAPVE